MAQCLEHSRCSLNVQRPEEVLFAFSRAILGRRKPLPSLDQRETLSSSPAQGAAGLLCHLLVGGGGRGGQGAGDSGAVVMLLERISS